MKSYLRALALLLLAAASLTGCGSPPEPPPSTPISLGPTRTPGPEDAPPVAQIQSEVARLRAEDASTSDTETRARTYLKSLEGKRVVDWHAWAYQNIASPDGTVLRLRAVYSDPYKEGATESFPFKRYGGGAVYFDLDGLTGDQIAQFRPGDELRLSGTIMDAYSIPRITVEEIQKVSPSSPAPEIPADLSDVVITFERNTCFFRCPVYKLTITGDGKVAYTGRQFVEKTGDAEGTISEENLRELVREFYRVDFFSLNDEYTLQASEGEATLITTIKIGDRSKMVTHYLGDHFAPHKLVILESKIDYLTSSAQWVLGAGGH